MKKIVKTEFLLGFFFIITLACTINTNNNSKTSASESVLQQNQLLNKWVGKYEGSFLRLETEAADPRSWANIVLEINRDSSTFYLFSYAEELYYKIKIVEINEKSIKFFICNSNSNNKIQMIEANNKYELEAGLISELIGKEQLVNMTRSPDE